MSSGISRRLLTATGVGAAVAAAGLGRQPAEAKKCKRSEVRTLQISTEGSVTVTETQVEFKFIIAQVYNSDGTVRYITDPKDLIPPEGESYDLQINGLATEEQPGTAGLDPAVIGMWFKVIGGLLTVIGDKLILLGSPTVATYADGREVRLRGAAGAPKAVIFTAPLMNSKV